MKISSSGRAAPSRTSPFAIVIEVEDDGRGLDHDRALAVGGAQLQAAGLRLAGAAPGLGVRLDPVVDGIAEDVHERVRHGGDDGLVDLDLLAGGFELDRLAQLPRHVADEPGHLLEERTHRHHAQRHSDLLELPRDLVELADGFAQDAASRQAAQLGRLADHGLGDDQLADEVHQPVQPVGVHADGFLERRLVLRSRGGDRRGRDRRFLRCRSGLARRAPDPEDQGREPRVAGGRCPRIQRVLDPAHEPLHRVHRFEDQVQRGSRDRQRPAAGQVEQCFGLVGELLDRAEVQAGGRALDRVEGAEERMDGLGLGRVVLEGEELRLGGVEVLARFHDESREDLGIERRGPGPRRPAGGRPRFLRRE